MGAARYVTRLAFCALGALLALPVPLVACPQLRWREVPDLLPRGSQAMAYDPVRQRLWMFGGNDNPLDDTWGWDGVRWQRRAPATSPPARQGAGMAFDPVRKSILLFGGADSKDLRSDTWEWDGRDWRRLAPKHSPPKRWFPAMAWDPVRRRIVLFGGGSSFLTSIGGIRALDDTWEWDGNDWKLLSPKNKPPSRYLAGLAWCAKSARLVLFGGTSDFALHGDTWEWTGSDWVQRRVQGPGPRSAVAMAHVAGRGTVLVYGGYRSDRKQSDETWEWNGQTWQKHTPASTPGVRPFPVAAAFDPREEVVLFGAADDESTWRDTWVWRHRDGNWHRVDDWGDPVHTLGGAAYDQARDQVVLVSHGGRHYDFRKPLKTWVLEHDGRYRLVPTKHAPSERWRPRMVYHPTLGKVFLWGGSGGQFVRPLDETWLFDGNDWTQLPGKGPPNAGSLVYDSHRDKIVALTATPATWEWDRTSGWTRKQTTQLPPRAAGTVIAYDPLRRRTVWFSSMVNPPQTWEYDGKQWMRLNPTVHPPRDGTHALEFFPPLGGVVMHASVGSCCTTWLWNGKNWQQLALHINRGYTDWPRDAVLDVGRERVLVFCDVATGLYSGTTSATWELIAETLKASQAYPHVGERFDFLVDLPTQPDRLFLLALALSPHPGIPLRIVPGSGVEVLPLAPDPLLWLSLGLGMATKLDRNGRGRIPFVIPNDTRLLWLEFHAAGWSLTPQLTAGAITNRVPIRVVK